VSFDASRFRDIAGYLLDEATFNDREALQRTAVGRLYYAMFLRARQYLRGRGDRAAALHSVVVTLDRIPELRGVAADLDALHALRNRCDYDDSTDLSDDIVHSALRLVRSIEAEMAPHW
jgi:hypothetical protein